MTGTVRVRMRLQGYCVGQEGRGGERGQRGEKKGCRNVGEKSVRGGGEKLKVNKTKTKRVRKEDYNMRTKLCV